MIKKSILFFFLLFGCFQNTFGSESVSFQSTLIKKNEQSPYFQIQFQRPSYILEKENTDKIIYYCDNSKEECKINFNLTQENGKKLSSTLSCEIKTNFESEQFSRCNPNTVIFPEGIHSISIKVTSKKNIENFSERKIIIINGEVDEEILRVEKEKIEQWLALKEDNEIKIVTTPVYSGEVVVRELISGEVKVTDKIISPNSISTLDERANTTVNIPEFQYIFQRPSYILKTDEDNKYTCDSSKGTECKINFKLLTLEGKDISSKLECEIGLDFISSEYKKCNPNTIIFPKGNHKVVFKIYEKGNSDNFKEKIIWLENKEIEIEEQQVTQNNTSKTLTKPLSSILTPSQEQGSNTTFTRKKHFLPPTKIAVQGKISKYKKVGYSQMTCYTYKQCSINFTSGKIYKSRREGVNFSWDFGNGIKYSGYNPKSIKFEPGFYKVKLVVADIYGNRKVEFYRVKVIELYRKTEIKKFNKQINYLINYEEEIYKSLNKKYFKLPKNYFEKKLSKERKYISKKIYKNISFEGFFGKKRKIKKNPQPPSGTSPFQEEEKIKKKLAKAKLKAFKKAEKLKRKQEKKKIALLKKNIKLRISKQKKNIKISGVTLPYSKVIISIGKQEFTLFANAKGKYQLKTHSIQAGVYKITASAYKNGKLIAQKSSKEKTFSQQYIAKMKNYALKKSKKSSKSKKKNKKYSSKKSKTKKFTIQTYLPNISNIIDANVFNIKIFVLNMFIAILSVILLFVILIKRKLI